MTDYKRCSKRNIAVNRHADNFTIIHQDWDHKVCRGHWHTGSCHPSSFGCVKKFKTLMLESFIFPVSMLSNDRRPSSPHDWQKQRQHQQEEKWLRAHKTPGSLESKAVIRDQRSGINKNNFPQYSPPKEGMHKFRKRNFRKHPIAVL